MWSKCLILQKVLGTCQEDSSEIVETEAPEPKTEAPEEEIVDPEPETEAPEEEVVDPEPEEPEPEPEGE